MDIISLIVTSLAQALSQLFKPIVKDAYLALRDTVKQRFGDNPEVSSTLDRFESKPEARAELLGEVLNDAGAGSDPEIVALAQQLRTILAQHGAEGAVSGNVMSGGQGNVQQNIGTMSGGSVTGMQTNYYGTKPE